MKVQTRLSIYSSIVFGIIFAVISGLLYGVYYGSTKKALNNNLVKTSQIIALFYLEEDELNKEDFAKVRKQFDDLVSNTYYQVYNENDSVSYGSNLVVIAPEMLNKIRKEESLSFSSDNFFCHGIYYEDNQGNFVVVAREKKDEIGNQLSSLLWILIAGFVVGMLAIIFLSKWIANIAYRPFRLVIKQVKNISTNNLNVHIKLPNTKDELQDLITTFNELLEKIADTFVIQKNFVKYVSHEFKTPLAAIQGNLEVFSIKDRKPEEYRQLSQKLIREINQLEDILNTLTIISDLRNSSDITTQVRIDELIWEIVPRVTGNYSNSKINVTLEITPEEEHLLFVTKDRTQLLMALFNIIENAVKYSVDKTVNINIYKKSDRLHVSIIDKGIGIPSDQLENISKPFFRADNTNQIQGSGIGLSIALRILEKNNIEYKIKSEINIGTEIILSF